MSKFMKCQSQACLCLLLCLFMPFSLSAKQSHSLPSGEVLYDPTEPYGKKSRTISKAKAYKPSFSLNYIMSAGDNRRAMINGKKVYEGDLISGARVKQITSEYVSLLYEGKEVTLYLKKIKKIRK